MTLTTILLDSILRDGRENYTDQPVIAHVFYPNNHTVGKEMDKSEKLLTKICPFHPNPPFPWGREGAQFLLKRDTFAKMAEIYTGKPEVLPLLPSGKEGSGENGEKI